MEDMKQIHDFAAKRSDKLRDQNTNCTVVPFPEFAALKAEVEKLRVEISMLLLERDELRFVICKNIETAYMLALGSLEYKAFELNCNVLRIKRKIDLIQAKKNRQEKIALSAIDKLLDKEFAGFQCQLNEQIDKMNKALDHSQGHVLTDEETKQIKKLYRSIVKALHPDLHPEITPAQMQLFQNAVQAYERDIFLFDTFIAGTTHIEGIEELAQYLNVNDKLDFYREPHNRFDPQAIVIKNSNGVKIGYVPREDNVVFSRLMDAGKLLFGKITAKETKGKWIKIKIGIYLHE